MLILRQFPLFATDQAGEESQHGYIMQPYSHLSMDVKINIQLSIPTLLQQDRMDLAARKEERKGEVWGKKGSVTRSDDSCITSFAMQNGNQDQLYGSQLIHWLTGLRFDKLLNY